MIPGGFGAISGGAGGVAPSFGGGTSGADGGEAGGSGGQVFNFAVPESVQLSNTLSAPLLLGAGVVVFWLLKRR
jgi:hypothetical protein